MELPERPNVTLGRLPPWSHARTLPHAPERYVAPAQLYCSRLDEKYLSLPPGSHGFLRPDTDAVAQGSDRRCGTLWWSSCLRGRSTTPNCERTRESGQIPGK